jgi:hypothetical protein
MPHTPTAPPSEYFTVLGYFTWYFSGAEHTLEACVVFIHQTVGKCGRNKLPKGLDGNLSFLSEAFAKLPKLAPFAAEGDALLSRFKALGEDRHFMVHGLAQTAQDGTIDLMRLQREPQHYILTRQSIDMQDANIRAQKAADLAGDFAAFSLSLCRGIAGAGN